jgi:hypothetical protein
VRDLGRVDAVFAPQLPQLVEDRRNERRPVRHGARRIGKIGTLGQPADRRLAQFAGRRAFEPGDRAAGQARHRRGHAEQRVADHFLGAGGNAAGRERRPW